MNYPPCKNCLVISMCKQKISGKDLFHLLGLSDECSLFREFMLKIDTCKGLLEDLQDSLLNGIEIDDSVTINISNVEKIKLKTEVIFRVDL